MALLDMIAELTGTLPGYSPFLASKHLNRAYREILDARNWSFLVADGFLILPAQVVAGTASITQFSATVTMDATASAALLAQTTVGAVPGLTNLQIRFAQTTPGAGQIYSIIDADATNPAAIVLTTDRVVVEATDSDSGYQVYRAYVTPPESDFKAWIDLVDMPNAIRLRKDATSAQFDAMDPQRASQGIAYWCGAYVGNRTSDFVTGATIPNPNVDQGTPIYELWPHSTTGQTLYVKFRRKGVELMQPTDLPLVEEGLLIQRALGWHSYQWAQANIAHFPTLKGPNYALLIQSARSYYQSELVDAKRNDNETQLQDVWRRGVGLRDGYTAVGMRFGYPIDSNFIQSHLVRF